MAELEIWDLHRDAAGPAESDIRGFQIGKCKSVDVTRKVEEHDGDEPLRKETRNSNHVWINPSNQSSQGSLVLPGGWNGWVPPHSRVTITIP